MRAAEMLDRPERRSDRRCYEKEPKADSPIPPQRARCSEPQHEKNLILFEPGQQRTGYECWPEQPFDREENSA